MDGCRTLSRQAFTEYHFSPNFLSGLAETAYQHGTSRQNNMLCCIAPWHAQYRVKQPSTYTPPPHNCAMVSFTSRRADSGSVS